MAEIFYFTYGSDDQPYSGGWTEVIAEDMGKAVAAFTAYHPRKNDLIPCCGIYDAKAFRATRMYNSGNLGARCHECIILGRIDEGGNKE